MGKNKKVLKIYQEFNGKEPYLFGEVLRRLKNEKF